MRRLLAWIFGNKKSVPLHPVEVAEAEREARVASAVERLMIDEAARYYAESENYGHDFNTFDRCCRKCKLDRREFDMAKRDRLWRDKAFCPGSKQEKQEESKS